MLIHIAPDELEEEYRESWKLGHIKFPSIDYADNAIHAVFEDQNRIIFRFDKFGWFNDNRYNSYLISAGSAGITIFIERN